MPTDSDFVRLASELVALKNDNYVLRQRVRCLENIVKWCMQYLTFVRTFSTLMFESNMPISAVIFNTDLFDLPYQLVEYTEVCTANVSKYMYETLYSMREFLHHSATIEPDAQMDYDESSEQIITQDDFRPVAEAQQHNPTSSRFFNQTNISQKSPTDRPDSSLEDDRTVNDLLGQDTDYNKLVWVDSAFDDDDLNWSDEPNILTTSSTVAPNTESEDPSETEDTQANDQSDAVETYIKEITDLINNNDKNLDKELGQLTRTNFNLTAFKSAVNIISSNREKGERKAEVVEKAKKLISKAEKSAQRQTVFDENRLKRPPQDISSGQGDEFDQLLRHATLKRARVSTMADFRTYVNNIRDRYMQFARDFNTGSQDFRLVSPFHDASSDETHQALLKDLTEILAKHKVPFSPQFLLKQTVLSEILLYFASSVFKYVPQLLVDLQTEEGLTFSVTNYVKTFVKFWEKQITVSVEPYYFAYSDRNFEDTTTEDSLDEVYNILNDRDLFSEEATKFLSNTEYKDVSRAFVDPLSRDIANVWRAYYVAATSGSQAKSLTVQPLAETERTELFKLFCKDLRDMSRDVFDRRLLDRAALVAVGKSDLLTNIKYSFFDQCCMLKMIIRFMLQRWHAGAPAFEGYDPVAELTQLIFGRCAKKVF